MTAAIHFCASTVARVPRRHTASFFLRKLKRMTIQHHLKLRLLVVAASIFPCFSACAADLMPQGAFVEGGIASGSGYSVTAGALWPWAWRGQVGSAQATASTEAFVSHWNSRSHGQRQSITQVGLVPLIRLRPDLGRSPWFLEGGIGISVMDTAYLAHGKRFGTRFNFVDVFGVGLSLGPNRQREVSLRMTHVSNANIKKPNPGETFLQVRYTATF